MTSPLIQPPTPGPRLVVICKEGVAVYHGRERVAYLRTDFAFNADDIEAIRLEDMSGTEVEVVV